MAELQRTGPVKINGLMHALPSVFIDKHRDVLAGWDWGKRPHMPFAEAFPDQPALANVVLETVSEARETIVRCMNGRSMLDLRAYADALSVPESG